MYSRKGKLNQSWIAICLNNCGGKASKNKDREAQGIPFFALLWDITSVHREVGKSTEGNTFHNYLERRQLTCRILSYRSKRGQPEESRAEKGYDPQVGGIRLRLQHFKGGQGRAGKTVEYDHSMGHPFPAKHAKKKEDRRKGTRKEAAGRKKTPRCAIFVTEREKRTLYGKGSIDVITNLRRTLQECQIHRGLRRSTSGDEKTLGK